MGYDAGKKVKGRKSHAVADNRDGCLPVLKEVRRLFPFLQRIVADGGYQGANTAAAKGFVTLPKHWIVERTFGWLNRCRRLARDVEHR